MASENPWVIDITVAGFQQDVIENSKSVPVVLDFWAPWCGPCRQLGPILEKLALDFQGKFLLGKINTDAEIQLASAFGIQSIPMVVAFVDGQPVDQFTGLMPEAEIRQWIEQLLPSPVDLFIKEGMELESTDPAAAERKYRAALELQQGDESILSRLARLLLAQGRLDETRSIIERLEKSGYLPPEAERVKSELEVRLGALESGGVEAARLAMEADSANLSLRIPYAEALAAAQQHRKALELLLETVQEDKPGAGVAAKDVMVQIFAMLGPTSELTSEYRRKLSTALY